jgi:hypothetical protein
MITFKFYPSILLFLLLSCASPAMAAKNQYKEWFPQWSPHFSQIMTDNCSTEYQEYLTGHSPPNYKSYLNDLVDNCILGVAEETLKANMQSAGVLLGLTPTILSLVGSSTAETALLSLRRPFLAFFLAAGSPSVNPIRAFEYHDPIAALGNRNGHVRIASKHTSCWQRAGIAAAEYALGMAAVANVAELGYRLGIRSVLAFAAPETFLQLLWTFTAILIHLCGCIVLRLQVEVVHELRSRKEPLVKRLQRWMAVEFSPCVFHGPTHLRWKQESYSFLIISWWTSTGTVMHIVFGTLVLSGTLFVSTQDATTVIVRYFASALMCRAVLMYELAGMRYASTIADDVIEESEVFQDLKK